MAGDVVRAAVRRYVASRRARIPGFVDRHFGLKGSLRLNRRAFGWDVARAPANLALAAPFLASRLAAVGARAGRFGRAADWLEHRSLYLTTDVAREVEWLIFTELLELPYSQKRRRTDRDALAEEVLRDPRVDAALERALEGLEQPADRRRLRLWLSDTMATYTNTRVSAADLTNALLGAGAGGLAFHKLTPGMMSLGPVAAQALAQKAAIAAFPLGAGAGALWYGAFPAAAPLAVGIGVTGGLMALGAVFAAFSGVITDPIQRALGFHRRRLERLIDSLERELADPGGGRYTVRDHYVARLLDVFEGLGALYRAVT